MRSWAARPDGTLVVTLSVSGPVHTTLDRLTVEILRLDTNGNRSGSDWITLDLAGSDRGQTLERIVTLDASDEVPDGLAVDLHPRPTEEEKTRIEELRRGS